jgi:hypothetical protein
VNAAGFVVLACLLAGCGDLAPPARKPSAGRTSSQLLNWTKLGDVTFPSKAAIASDPSYASDKDLAVTVDLGHVDWEAWYAESPADPGRVAQLALVRPGAKADGAFGEDFGDSGVAVDSGQAGFFDPAHADRDDEVVGPLADLGDQIDAQRWYRMCCARTLADPPVGLIPHGVVTAAGYGDGAYSVYVRRDAANAVETVRMDFITEEELNDASPK